MHHPTLNRPRWHQVLALLLLTLVGASLLTSGLVLALQVPLLNSWADVAGQELIVGFNRTSLAVDHHFGIDLEDGSMEFRQNSRERLPLSDSDDSAFAIEVNAALAPNTPVPASYKPYVMVASNAEGQAQEFPFNFPVTPFALEERLVVGHQNEQLCWLDPAAGTLQTYDFYQSSISRLLPIPNSRRFMLVGQGLYPLAGTPPLGGAMAAPPFTAALLEIDEQFQLQTIWTRQLPGLDACSVDKDSIYLLTSLGTTLERFRHDGALLEQIPLPAECVATMSSNPGDLSIPYPGDFLSLRWPMQRSLHWTLPDLNLLQLPERDVSLMRLMGSERLVAYYEESPWSFSVTVHDLELQKDLWTYARARPLNGFSQDPQRGLLYFVTGQHGVSVDVVSTTTGEIVAHLTPFAWVSWLLPTTIIGFVIWCIVTVRLAAGSRWRYVLPWLLPLLPLATLVTHLSAWQMTSLPSFAHNYIQGIFVGLLSTCSAWLIWGSGRPVVRMLPFVLVMALLIALARLMLDRKELVFEAVWTTVSITVFPLLVFGGMRLLGLRFGRAALPGSQRRSAPSLLIRDLFLLSTAAAVLLAIAQPFLSMVSMPQSLPPGFYPAAIAESIMLLGLAAMVVLSSRGYHKTLACVALLIAAALALEATYQFATGHWLVLEREAFEMVLFRGVATSLCTFGVMLQATAVWYRQSAVHDEAAIDVDRLAGNLLCPLG